MKFKISLIALFVSFTSYGQVAQTYQNKREETHLCGPFQINDLMQEPYSDWFIKGYEEYALSEKSHKWVNKLKDFSVEIYIGTWCGDSKTWVPQFVKLWDELGLDRDQLSFIALYDGTEKYKQGPNAEEKGRNIHRVPTFIFSKNGEEYARIVESPRNDLETDLAQIALGYPSQPNYRAATYMMQLLESKSVDEMNENRREYVNAAYRLTGKSNELNTLGYVYLRSGRMREALTVFEYNTYFFRNDPNVYDSYGEALAMDGQIERAIENYERVLKIDSENENAKQQIELLKQSVAESE